jgi:hypothetical protein
MRLMHHSVLLALWYCGGYRALLTAVLVELWIKPISRKAPIDQRFSPVSGTYKHSVILTIGSVSLNLMPLPAD